MNTKTILWIVIGIMLLVVLYMTFKTPILGNSNAQAGTIDMSGWTENEKMNYEMHGTLPARVQQSNVQQSQGNGMVGGC